MLVETLVQKLAGLRVAELAAPVPGLLAGKKLHESGAKLHDYRPFDLAMRPLRADVPIYVAALRERMLGPQ